MNHPAWLVVGMLWMLIMVLTFAWMDERTTSHKLRANLAACLAANQTPPMYWQPEWSDE